MSEEMDSHATAASPETPWPPCRCDSLNQETGMCSPRAEDHAPECPRGLFISERNERIAAARDLEDAREEAASEFGGRAEEIYQVTGDPRKALDVLNADPEGLIRAFIGELAEAFAQNRADGWGRRDAIEDLVHEFLEKPGRVDLCLSFANRAS